MMDSYQFHKIRVLGLACCMLLAAVVSIGGCGSRGVPVARVSGRVTFRGEPVALGEVIFLSDAGYGSSSPLNEDGTFTLVSEHGRGIPLGEYAVAITPPDPDEFPDPDGMKFRNIPEKYRHFGSSGLTAVVESGSNVFEFHLQ